MADDWDHPTLTREQFAARTAELKAQEALEPLTWWWLSFCDPAKPKGEQFLGVAIVRAHGMLTAIIESKRQNCNPGGEVMGFPIKLYVPEVRTNQLLNRREAAEFWKLVSGTDIAAD